MRCRGGGTGPKGTGVSLSAKAGGTERTAVGTLPVAAAGRGNRLRVEAVGSDGARLGRRWRKAEDLGDDGFGGA